MISREPAAWTRRVIRSGAHSITPQQSWQHEAYAQYREKLQASDYPCFFGQAAEARGEMLYTFVGSGYLDEMAESIRQFVALTGTAGYERASLAAFFEPDASIRDHAGFVARFWHILRYLHEHDRHPATERSPDEPLWEFSFEGCEMFVVGTSPTYRRRRSRNLGPGIALIFQPRFLFLDPATSQPIAPSVRRRIHERMHAYDGMTVHPDIGFFGDANNCEWKQYALPDDNEPETGRCPFHVRERQGVIRT